MVDGCLRLFAESQRLKEADHIIHRCACAGSQHLLHNRRSIPEAQLLPGGGADLRAGGRCQSDVFGIRDSQTLIKIHGAQASKIESNVS